MRRLDWNWWATLVVYSVVCVAGLFYWLTDDVLRAIFCLLLQQWVWKIRMQQREG